MDDNIEQMFHDMDNLGHILRIPRLPLVRCYYRGNLDPFSFFTEGEFRMRFRFSKLVVRNKILPLISLQNRGNERGLPIPSEIQLLVALRFYATASFQKVYADMMFISQSTVCRIIQYVTTNIAAKLQQFVKFPEAPGSLQAIKEQFFNLGARTNTPGLPNIIGAIDCTHVKICRPRGMDHTEAYRNRHGWFSINVQVTCGPDMKILDVVARWPGSYHDSRIFRNSRLNSKLSTRELDGVLVGDGGYACTPVMLTPLRTPNTPAERKYNEVQIRTRNVIERTFGVLKKRFPCLQRGLSNKVSTSCKIILACVILHNIGLQENDVEAFESEDDEQIQPVVQARRVNMDGLAFRLEIIRNLYS